MNRCKICGDPCGIYDICRKCQKDIEEGKIVVCPFCGKYHLADKICTCQGEPLPSDESRAKENINVSIATEDSGAFGKGFGVTLGVGCGCLAIVFIILMIAVFSGAVVFNSLF